MTKPQNQAVELGQLLSTTIASVVQAQEQLDIYTEGRRLAYESAAQGSLAVPPIWYTFQNVAIEMELSTTIAEVENINTGEKTPHLLSRTLNPGAVSLYGYQASSGLRVRLHLVPQGFVPIKIDSAKPDATSAESDTEATSE